MRLKLTINKAIKITYDLNLFFSYNYAYILVIMNLFFTKYRKNFAAIILTAYSILVLVSVFHFHHIDIQSGQYKLKSENAESTNPFDKFIDASHECTIQHFTDIVFANSFTSSTYFISNIPDVKIFISNKLVKFSSVPFLKSYPLRAPPALS